MALLAVVRFLATKICPGFAELSSLKGHLLFHAPELEWLRHA